MEHIFAWATSTNPLAGPEEGGGGGGPAVSFNLTAERPLEYQADIQVMPDPIATAELVVAATSVVIIGGGLRARNDYFVPEHTVVGNEAWTPWVSLLKDGAGYGDISASAGPQREVEVTLNPPTLTVLFPGTYELQLIARYTSTDENGSAAELGPAFIRDLTVGVVVLPLA